MSFSIWTVSLNKKAHRAHDAWVARGRFGEGRIVREDEDLREAQPRGFLHWARFVRCDLSGSKLSLDRLDGIELLDCKLHHAVMVQARLRGAVLERCSFRSACLRLARLDGARISGGDFGNVAFKRSSWSGAIVVDVDFGGSELTDTVLDRTRFARCDLRGSDLRRIEASFDRGRAYDATFERCDFRGALLEGWRLRDTSFIDCKFGGAVGKPVLEGPIQVTHADLSEAGDGTMLVGTEELVALWSPASAPGEPE